MRIEHRTRTSDQEEERELHIFIEACRVEAAERFEQQTWYAQKRLTEIAARAEVYLIPEDTDDLSSLSFLPSRQEG